MEKIQLKTRNETEIIIVDDIIRIEADGNYSIIFTNGEEKRISKKISYFQNELNHLDFIRIHNSHLINVKHIKAVKYGKKMIIQLDNNLLLPISETYKDALVKRLGEEFKLI